MRWHSPPDWTETIDDDCVPFDEEDSSSRRGGRLSRRMQKEGKFSLIALVLLIDRHFMSNNVTNENISLIHP